MKPTVVARAVAAAMIAVVAKLGTALKAAGGTKSAVAAAVAAAATMAVGSNEEKK